MTCNSRKMQSDDRFNSGRRQTRLAGGCAYDARLLPPRLATE